MKWNGNAGFYIDTIHSGAHAYQLPIYSQNNFLHSVWKHITQLNKVSVKMSNIKMHVFIFGDNGKWLTFSYIIRYNAVNLIIRFNSFCFWTAHFLFPFLSPLLLFQAWLLRVEFFCFSTLTTDETKKGHLSNLEEWAWF